MLISKKKNITEAQPEHLSRLYLPDYTLARGKNDSDTPLNIITTGPANILSFVPNRLRIKLGYVIYPS